MKNDYLLDYLACKVFRLFGPLVRVLPLGVALFLGRLIGGLVFHFDAKHRAIAYANIKRAHAGQLAQKEIEGIVRDFYRSFGQNLIDIFLIPKVDSEYIKKHIVIEGRENIDAAFKIGKGVIFLAVHAGSWELSNVICASGGVPFSLFIRQQRMPRLNQLLNDYRRQRGCRIIETKNQTRELIRVLRNNESIGMTVDQGGKTGTLVDFFGCRASMSSGAVRIALKYDAVILPVFHTRVRGPNHKIIVDNLYQVKRTGNLENDIKNNLQSLVEIFQEHIKKSPGEYFWSYKIWKYSDQRSVLILSDGKAGHLRQAQAVAGTIKDYVSQKGITVSVKTVTVDFRNKFSRYALIFCRGCLKALKRVLEKDVFDSLNRITADLVISCGSSLAAVNYLVAKQNYAKSIVIMRPKFLSLKKFGLVIMPHHDHPPKRNNVVETIGALNLIDGDYLKEQSKELLRESNINNPDSSFNIGLLIGGDSKDFHLDKRLMKVIIEQLKSFSEQKASGILATTSRRTSPEIESLLKDEFRGYAYCKLLVIANENNLASAVGGILGLTQIVIVSSESISMISEAASSGRYVVVFNSQVSRRHRDFLDYLARNKYIYLADSSEIFSVIEKIKTEAPQINILSDRATVKEALAGLL